MRINLCWIALPVAAGLLWGQSGSLMIWAPKPQKVPGYKAPHKPVTRIAELLAKHKGQANWEEVVVNDEHLFAKYISSAPGTKTPKRLHPDTREWWVIRDGQIRFEIEGQEPFVASEGWLVQVPMRNAYSMETIGDKPSVRFEVNVAGAQTVYPQDVKPPAMPGWDWLPIRLPQERGKYDNGNKPYLVFNEIAAGFEKQPRKAGQVRFIHDDRAVSNVIYGYAKDLPPAKPGERGHYHPECAEFWVILTGQVQYEIEGQPKIIAEKGDVVYAPRFTFHRPAHYGEAASCRLAMNGFTGIAHLFDADPVPAARSSN